MILIADSGATKTDWCIANDPENPCIIQTQGINPFHQSKEHISLVLGQELLPQLECTDGITQIHFYGAGCTLEKSITVKEVLQTFFSQANIHVHSDLLGAARSLCGKKPGIACILGTGSNSCFYDGIRITDNVSPLGYILGDEGSGAYLGKRLVSDCLKRQLSENVSTLFLKHLDLSPEMIIDRVYRQPQANRFLAGLTPFLSAHRDIPEIQALLVSCFTDFFQRNVMQYEYNNVEVHFTGSVAWYFQEEVKKAAKALNIRIGKFIKNPIHGLINYHLIPIER